MNNKHKKFMKKETQAETFTLVSSQTPPTHNFSPHPLNKPIKNNQRKEAKKKKRKSWEDFSSFKNQLIDVSPLGET